jgi:hypothetical protein
MATVLLDGIVAQIILVLKLILAQLILMGLPVQDLIFHVHMELLVVHKDNVIFQIELTFAQMEKFIC